MLCSCGPAAAKPAALPGGRPSRFPRSLPLKGCTLVTLTIVCRLEQYYLEPLCEGVFCTSVVKQKLCEKCFSNGHKWFKVSIPSIIPWSWPIKWSCWHLSVGCNKVYKPKCSHNVSFHLIWECPLDHTCSWGISLHQKHKFKCLFKQKEKCFFSKFSMQKLRRIHNCFYILYWLLLIQTETTCCFLTECYSRYGIILL